MIKMMIKMSIKRMTKTIINAKQELMMTLKMITWIQQYSSDDQDQKASNVLRGTWKQPSTISIITLYLYQRDCSQKMRI